MIILLCLMFKALAEEKFLEYKFGETLGIYVKDSSGAKRHGTVSGNTSPSSWTSRGIYINSNNKIIPKSSSFRIPATIFMWILPVECQGTLFSLLNRRSRTMIISFEKKYFQMCRFRDFREESKIKYSTPLNDQKWILVRTYLKQNEYYGGFRPFIHSDLKHTGYRSTDEIAWVYIGYYNINFPAIKAFIWYFVVIKGNIEYSQFYSESNSCINTQFCIQCSYFIVDPVHGNMCLSNSTNLNENPVYSICNTSTCLSLTFANSCNCVSYCNYDLISQNTTCDGQSNTCPSPNVQL